MIAAMRRCPVEYAAIFQGHKENPLQEGRQRFDRVTALSKLFEKCSGLVISDWNMQPITEYMLLERVRAEVDLSTIPFIMVTAEFSQAKVITAKEAGASNYVVKPFTGEMLKEKITAVLA